MSTTKQHTSTAQGDDTGAGNSATDPVRTPLLAALGAGNLATQAVVDVVHKAKERVDEGSESARRSLDDLPTDFESLRERLDPAELRKVLDEYADTAWKWYSKLASSGEEAWDNVASQPQVKRAIEQLEEALQTAQGRFDDVTTDARERLDDALGKVTKRTRSTGEKAARVVEGTTADAAEKVEDLGEDLAHETRSAARKTANKTAPSASNSGGSARQSSGSGSGSTGASSGGSNGARKNSSTGSKNTK